MYVRGGTEGLIVGGSGFTGSILIPEGGNPMKFDVNSSERMRISPAGTILFNDTTSYGSDGAHVTNVSFSGTRATCGYENNRGSTDTVYPITGYNSGGGIAGSVSFVYSSMAFNTSSDYRLKENVANITNATTVLKQLRPVNFEWKDDPDDTTQWGFLAHEAQAVFPTSVTGTKDAITPQVLWAEGDEIPEGKSVGDEKDPEKIDPQQMDHSKLVPLLVATIQELEARVKTLEG